MSDSRFASATVLWDVCDDTFLEVDANTSPLRTIFREHRPTQRFLEIKITRPRRCFLNARA